MNVVTYARVSTIGQESKGESLQNQEAAFVRWLERSGNTRILAYSETASAGTIAGRVKFQQMLADLPRTKPDLIVVDTLDRFTRNLREGLNTLEQLRGHHVALLPLDWHRERPINLDDDRDWQEVVEEFTAAERERRRIRRRILRYYEGRRERGAITTNKAPFGLLRDGERFIADQQRAWIVQEADKRVLAGQTYADVLRWAISVDEASWRTLSGLKSALANAAYVTAGVRPPNVHRAIAQHLESMRSRHGQRRKHPHEFTGVFACGLCVDGGTPPAQALMSGIGRSPGPETKGKRRFDPYPNIQCARRNNKKRQPGESNPELLRHAFRVAEGKVAQAWRTYIYALAAPDALARWVAGGEANAQDRERRLLARLAEIDRKAAALKKRRDAAFDLLADRDAGIAKQARKMLTEVESDEMTLAVQRQTVLGELAHEPIHARDPQRLGDALANFATRYEKASAQTRNRLNRALCAAIGSHPRVYREDPTKGRWSKIVVVWPEVDALLKGRVRTQLDRPTSPRLNSPSRRSR